MKIYSVVGALDFYEDFLHLLGLLLPGILVILESIVKQLLIGLAVGAANTVPECRVLTVVVVEVQMVDSVAGGAIDKDVVHDKVAVVDHDGPHVDKHEQKKVRNLMEWEDEGEDVVGYGLDETIQRVEGVRSKWRRDDPLVVRLVKTLVENRVVKAAVHQIHAKVREENKERELENEIPQGILVGTEIEL